VTLDPEFDFIAVATDYLTEQGYREESVKQFFEQASDQVQASAQSLVRVPPKLERTLDRTDRDDLYVRVNVEDDDDVFDMFAKRLVYGMLLSFSLLTTGLLYTFSTLRAAVVAAAFSLVVAGLLYRSFRERSGIRATPQFTRQNLRQREERD
jgi:predicted unusual protein kinase regulating ubiquinone biosynthesis (AarF/ABC1/UbiB family)